MRNCNPLIPFVIGFPPRCNFLSSLLLSSQTSRLSPPEFEAALFNVVLPTTDYKRATDLQTYLLNEYGIYMLALLDEPTSIVYTRLSAQIYLERDDFVKVGDLVLDFLSK